jgi:pimeloyl-ACP methyl ester carboxylesterase
MTHAHDISFPIPEGDLYGILTVPPDASGMVVFAHGSGSGRHSPRNQAVAATLKDAEFGTLLFDLLTEAEDAVDQRTREHRFNIPLLAERLIVATAWLGNRADTAGLPIGYFGASTGAAAALIAAARRPDTRAVVSRGGRPDLAGEALDEVRAPTLLIVGERDETVIGMNERARGHLQGTSELVIIPGATHLFEEPGAMEQVTRHAVDWFQRFLTPHGT